MSIDSLSRIIAGGLPSDINRDTLAEQTKQAIDGLFGSRYQARSRYSVRAALMPGADAVSFAGLVHEDSPTSGVYGGMSLIWFPVEGLPGRVVAHRDRYADLIGESLDFKLPQLCDENHRHPRQNSTVAFPDPPRMRFRSSDVITH